MKTPPSSWLEGSRGRRDFEKKYSGALTVGMIGKAKSWEEGRSVEEGEKVRKVRRGNCGTGKKVICRV